MFYLRMAVRSLRRCGQRSMLCMLICLASVLLLHLYAGNLEDLEQMRKNLPEAMEVTAKICNLDGSMDHGLKIKEELLSKLLKSESVAEPAASVQLLADIGAPGAGDRKRVPALEAVGVNCLKGAGDLRPEDVFLPEGTTLAFLASDERKCLADRALLEDKGYRTGDRMVLDLFCYRYGDYHEVFCEPLEQCEYEIAGMVDAGGAEYPELILPLGAVRDSYARAGYPFLANSFSFVVKNPLELNAFKEEMHSLGFLPVSVGAELHYEGNALVVRDESFIKAAERIEENLTLLRGFLPLILFITAGAGYLTAHLFIQDRRQEYALFRSMGLGRVKSGLVFSAEYLLLAAAGCGLGTLCARAAVPESGSRLLAVAAVSMGCCIPGMLAAFVSMSRRGVMQLLARKD
ncbi:MAG: hypothetical protein K1W28_12670 [Lachnospiraceae bacterium]